MRAVQSIIDEHLKIEEAIATGAPHPRLRTSEGLHASRAASRAASARARSPRRRSRSTARRGSRERNSGYTPRTVGGAAALPRTASREPIPSVEEIGVDWNGQGGTQRSQRPVPPVAYPFAEKEERLYWWDTDRRRWTQTRVIRDRAEAEEARQIGWTGDLLECEIATWAPSGGIRLVENNARQSPPRFGSSDVRKCRCPELEKYGGGLPWPPLNRYGNCSACGLVRDQVPEP